MSVIEALAARRPVVATDVGGVSDVVRDGVDGFLVEAGDTTALAERLAVLAGDRGLRARMGEAGGSRVLARYAVDAARGRRRPALPLAARDQAAPVSVGQRAERVVAGLLRPARRHQPGLPPSARYVSSLSMNQMNMSIRGCRFAFVHACRM